MENIKNNEVSDNEQEYKDNNSKEVEYLNKLYNGEPRDDDEKDINFKTKKLAEFDEKFNEKSELVKFLVAKYGSFLLHEPYINLVKQFISDLIDECEKDFTEEAVNQIRLDTLKELIMESESNRLDGNSESNKGKISWEMYR